MMKRVFGVLGASVCVAATATATAQGPGAAPEIAIRKLPAPTHVTTVTFTNIQHIRRLSDGHVLINDGSRRQILMLDSSLANPVMVIDSAGGRENSYGSRAGALIAYRGDSTLFVDPTSQSFLVIDGAGKIARIMSLPNMNTASYMTLPTSYGYPGFSESFGLVFMGPGVNRPPYTYPPEGAPEVVIRWDDSAAVFGMKISTRKIDTLGKFATGRSSIMRLSYQSSMSTTAPGTDLFPVLDDWAAMSDGSIALFSGREYRVHWINPDGTKSDGPRLPYPWRRLTDDDKQKMADSINAVREKQYQDRVAMQAKAVATADSIAKAAKDPSNKDAKVAAASAPAGGRGASPIASRVGSSMITMSDGTVLFLDRPLGGGAPVPPTRAPKVDMIEIPDYIPAVERVSNWLRADGDNRLWIRPKQVKPVPGAQIYDIVDRKGELIDRVQVPTGRTIVGFGTGGYIYLLARDAGTVKLEQVMFK